MLTAPHAQHLGSLVSWGPTPCGSRGLSPPASPSCHASPVPGQLLRGVLWASARSDSREGTGELAPRKARSRHRGQPQPLACGQDGLLPPRLEYERGS